MEEKKETTLQVTFGSKKRSKKRDGNKKDIFCEGSAVREGDESSFDFLFRVTLHQHSQDLQNCFEQGSFFFFLDHLTCFFVFFCSYVCHIFSDKADKQLCNIFRCLNCLALWFHFFSNPSLFFIFFFSLNSHARSAGEN